MDDLLKQLIEGAVWHEWLMVADQLEDAGRLAEAEEVRSGRPVVIWSIRSSSPSLGIDGGLHYRVLRPTEEELRIGRVSAPIRP